MGWGRTQAEPGFGASYDSTSVKAKTINLIASVRTVMRSTLPTSNPCVVRSADLSNLRTSSQELTTSSTPHHHQHCHHCVRADPGLSSTLYLFHCGPNTPSIRSLLTTELPIASPISFQSARFPYNIPSSEWNPESREPQTHTATQTT